MKKPTKNVREQIKRLLREAYPGEHIFVNHVIPLDDPDHEEYYLVEYKIMSRAAGMAHFYRDEADGRIKRLKK